MTEPVAPDAASDYDARLAHAELLVQTMDFRPPKAPQKLLDLMSLMLSPLEVELDQEGLFQALKARSAEIRAAYYAETFTLSELVEAVGFYQGPVGQKLIEIAHKTTDIDGTDELTMLGVMSEHVKQKDGSPVDLVRVLRELTEMGALGGALGGGDAELSGEDEDEELSGEMGEVNAADAAEAAQAAAEEAERVTPEMEEADIGASGER